MKAILRAAYFPVFTVLVVVHFSLLFTVFTFSALPFMDIQTISKSETFCNQGFVTT